MSEATRPSSAGKDAGALFAQIAADDAAVERIRLFVHECTGRNLGTVGVRLVLNAAAREAGS